MERWEEKENREYLRAGTIAAAAANPYRGKDRQNRPLTAHDFFNLPRPEPREPSAKERAARMDEFFRVHNAKFVRIRDKKQKKKAG